MSILDHKWGVSVAADHVRSLVCGQGRRASSVSLMFWRAFCDESEGRSGDGWFVLAGYVAPAQVWEKFSVEWESLIPLLPNYMDGVFKMSKLMGSDYYGERALAFYRVVENFELISISCVVNRRDFQDAFEGVMWPKDRIRNWTQFRKDMTNPYIFALRAIVLKLCEVQEQFGIVEPVNFVFDERSEQAKILGAWGYLRESVDTDTRRNLGSTPVFEPEDRLMPLQAADMWAWLVRIWQSEPGDEHWTDANNPRFPWLYKTALGKGFAVEFNRDDIRSEMEKVSALVLSHLDGQS